MSIVIMVAITVMLMAIIMLIAMVIVMLTAMVTAMVTVMAIVILNPLTAMLSTAVIMTMCIMQTNKQKVAPQRVVLRKRLRLLTITKLAKLRKLSY